MPATSERLHLTEDGQVRLELRQPWRDGTTAVVFDPAEFLGRLAVLVPRPRINPGQPAFWLLARLLAMDGVPSPLDPPPLVVPGAARESADEIGDLDRMPYDSGGPHLTTPNLRALVEMADVKRPKLATTRMVLLTALRKAAEQRMAGVTAEKRRRHHGHAARLVAACAVADPTPETAAWVAGVRAKYRRYPALQDEFDHWLNRR